MATRADLDTFLASFVTTLNTALDNLEAKLTSGTVTTPEDFQAEIDSLRGTLNKATSDDPGLQPTGDAPTA